MSKYGIHSSPFVLSGKILWLYRMLAKGLPTQQVTITESNLRKKCYMANIFYKESVSFLKKTYFIITHSSCQTPLLACIIYMPLDNDGNDISCISVEL